MPAQPPKVSERPPMLRLAYRLREQLLAGRSAIPSGIVYALDNLSSRAEQVVAICRRLDLCRHHHLTLAAPKVLEELQEMLRYLPEEVDQVTRQLPAAAQEQPVLPVVELVHELEHVDEEFGAWTYRKDEDELVVATEPIVLEDRDLGPFEIRLNLDRVGRNSRQNCYKIVALEPHPASSNDAVTHPHVSDEHLCEGEAAAPIHAALTEGRIGDFFILVRCVLTTYNPSSPYVALDQWEGYPCYDCGSITDDDCRYYCSACDHDFCGECSSSCRCCDDSRCRGCLEDCPNCQESTCEHCMKHCNACGGRCCSSCLDEGLCPECMKAKESSESSDPANEGAHHESQSPSVCADVGAPAGESGESGDHGGQVQSHPTSASIPETPIPVPAMPRRTRRRTRHTHPRRRSGHRTTPAAA